MSLARNIRLAKEVRKRPTISDDVNFVMSVILLILFWFINTKSTNRLMAVLS